MVPCWEPTTIYGMRTGETGADIEIRDKQLHPTVSMWCNYLSLSVIPFCSTPTLIYSPGSTLKYLLLTHWGRVTHICVSKLTIIGSDNGLSPGRRQAIIWTNAGILLLSTAKWRPSCLGLNVLNISEHVIIKNLQSCWASLRVCFLVCPYAFQWTRNCNLPLNR